MAPLSGWWEWQVPGTTDALQLTRDFKLVKHNIKEQPRAQQITQLIASGHGNLPACTTTQTEGWFVPASLLSRQNGNARCFAHCSQEVCGQQSRHTNEA